MENQTRAEPVTRGGPAFEIGTRYRFRWLDRDYVEQETTGILEATGDLNVLVHPDGWRRAEYLSIDRRRLLSWSEVVGCE